MTGLLDDDLLSMADLTNFFDVTKQTINGWTRNHGFPAPIKLNAGVSRYSEKAVAEWIRSKAKDTNDLVDLQARAAFASCAAGEHPGKLPIDVLAATVGLIHNEVIKQGLDPADYGFSTPTKEEDKS